jgi:hypothetical protein
MTARLVRGMLRCCLATMLLGVTLMSGPALAAVVHSDFDPGGTYFGGVEGWFNYDGNPGFATSTPAGGSTNWLGVKPGQYWGKITSQNWAVPDVTVGTWNSHTHLTFDVIVDSLWLPNNASQAISVEFQVGGGSSPSTQSVNATINSSLKDTVQQVSIPLASLQPFDPTSTFWNLSFNLFPGYAWEWDSNNPSVQPYNAHYNIDNVAWVPEPGTALVAILGGVLIAMNAHRHSRRAAG